MEIESLKLFLHLAKTLHFGRTSRDCHVTASTLTRTIQRLEDEVGKTLFWRDNRHVNLTEVGQIFQKFCEEIIGRWELMKGHLTQDPKELPGSIRVYCSVTASYTILPELLNMFRKEYPKVQFEIETGDAENTIQSILEDQADIGIAALPNNLPKEIVYSPLVQIPLVAVQSKKRPEVRDWETAPWILPAYGVARQLIDDWMEKKGWSPTVTGRVSGFEGVLSLVNANYGIGIVPKLVVDKSPLKSNLKILELAPPLPHLRVGVCVKERRLMFAQVEGFWKMLQDQQHTLESNIE